jgi:nitroreductase
MELLDAVRTRRSVRQWTTEPIEDEQLELLVEAAARAPSGSNSQPWAFVVIREPGRLYRVRAASPGISGAPTAVVIICLDRLKTDWDLDKGLDEMDLLSLGAALQNLLLAAHGQGLGACAIGSFHIPSVRSIVSLPQHLEPKLLVALGHPVSQPDPPSLRPLNEICHFEEVGASGEH